MLKGLMALYFTDIEHDTPGIAEKKRNYDLIYIASHVAASAVLHADLNKLAEAVKMSYKAQTEEGMETLIDAEKCLAHKYCGGGWGGYALYMFETKKSRDKFVARYTQAKAIEPYTR